MSETLALYDHPDGTLAELTERGETASLGQHVNWWRINRRFMWRLKRFCETGAAETQAPGALPAWKSLAISAAAVATFSLWFGWIGALVLAAIIVLHEFGHWAAMRLTDQRAPRMMLVPFFGGVAVANHPHKSLFDDAFCALMGPALSVLPCLALLVLATEIGVSKVVAGIGGPPAVASPTDYLSLAALAAACVLGVFNGLQLLPLPPLDGGQILGAIMQSTRAAWARPLLLGLTGVGIVAFVSFGDFIIAGILVLGGLQAWYMGHGRPAARPMAGHEITVISSAYAMTFAVHALAGTYSGSTCIEQAIGPSG